MMMLLLMLMLMRCNSALFPYLGDVSPERQLHSQHHKFHSLIHTVDHQHSGTGLLIILYVLTSLESLNLRGHSYLQRAMAYEGAHS